MGSPNKIRQSRKMISGKVSPVVQCRSPVGPRWMLPVSDMWNSNLADPNFIAAEILWSNAWKAILLLVKQTKNAGELGGRAMIWLYNTY